MAKKKIQKEHKADDVVAPIVDQPITETVEKNYMPYVMSVIISRAIPEIDGFKPAHRKVLYTMYKQGLLTGPRTKSANVVGQTMKIHPHGDASIYDTLVRLTRGHEALLHPFVDSKGSFGKHYSSDMAYAAPRYTEVKLDPFCAEIFKGIDKTAVEMVPNYDNTMVEPVLLPTTFPNILVSANMGIAVGMASRICSFNLGEVCDGAIQVLRNPNTDVDQMLDIIKAPDFQGGAYIIYDRKQLADIYATGRGSFTMRAKYVYDKSSNCIDIIEIPYSTSLEAIMKRLTEMIKNGSLKEVSDFRDEIDLKGFKLTLDLKRGIDPDKLMNKLFRQTPLEDEFSCNFNVLIDSAPRQIGVIEILKEWIRFRMDCVRRELSFDLGKKEERLHLLEGLREILLDIDKAIKIIRDTKNDKDVIPNLMTGFHIDEVQAEFIAEIKLRHLNREYIISRLDEIKKLTEEIADLKSLITSEAKLKNYIAKQLKEIKAKYGKERRTELMYAEDIVFEPEEEIVDTTPVRVVLTKDGYFKKITMQSLRGNDEHNLKEGDSVSVSEDATNSDDIIFFTDKAQCYKSNASAFDYSKASQLGDYIPSKLAMDKDEKVIFMKCIKGNDYSKGNFMFFFENGKGVKVPVLAYETKTNRKKLVGAFSDISPIVKIIYEEDPVELLFISNAKRGIVISSNLVPVKASRSSQGVSIFTLKGGQKLVDVLVDFADKFTSSKSLKKIKIPATGIAIEEYDAEKQQIQLI
ncbi:MAG: topoisomerase IV [Clostridia bacterium]|nr:topoisomerase IV [Clostridia bacterium]